MSDSCDQPTKAEIAAMEAQFAAQATAIKPAADSPPRLRAKLPLAAGGRLLFSAWRTVAGKSCYDVVEEDADGGGGNGAAGPCEPRPTPCQEICVEPISTGDGMTSGAVVGVVDARADELRLTTADGAIWRYPLRGPTLDGTSWRIFMADLGPKIEERIELYAGDERLGKVERGGAEVQFDLCSRGLGDPFTGVDDSADSDAAVEAALKAWDKQLEDCLRRSGIGEGVADGDGPTSTSGPKTLFVIGSDAGTADGPAK